jgi:hypothetical protein
MLAKNTRASVATVAAALITGLVVALWVALMPAPAQAQAGDELQLLKLKAVDLEDPDWFPFTDNEDEASIKVDGKHMGLWHMKQGQIVNLVDAGVPPQPLLGRNAEVQLWEAGGGHAANPDVLLGEFLVEYTDGTDQTQEIKLGNGKVEYEITYVVKRPSPEPTNPDPGTTNPDPGTTNTAPTIDPIKPVTGSKIHNRSPLIEAKVSDAQTNLAQGDINLSVDGKPITNFSYDAATDRLSYRSDKLAYGGHKVKVKATDADGLEGKKTWRFKVVKR